MKTDKDPAKTYWKIRMAAIGCCLILLFAVLIASTKADMKNTEARLSDTVNYIRKQCTTYNSLNLASEVKSLLRIAESAQQVDRNIGEASGFTPEDLEQYASQLFLTGILVIEPDGTLEGEYHGSDINFDLLLKELDKAVVLDTAEHPKKNYCERMTCADGSYIDVAVVGRSDKNGMIAAYYHTPLDYVETYSLSFQNLLSGYIVENAGTIVVTSGDIVTASNDEELIGRSVGEITTLSNIRTQAKNGKMVHVRSNASVSNQSFGVLDRGRDYYIYAYQSERSVFESTPRRIVLAAIGCVVALLLLQILGWKTTEGYREEKLRQELAYQEKLKTEARKAESANRAKTEFLQRMSHDIRTPINGIRGMVEIGEHFSGDLEKQAECRKKIWDASGLLLELVNEVLDMGKLESGEVVLENRSFDLPELLDETKAAIEQSAEERGITISRSPRKLPHTRLIGSPLHIKRMLMNILTNAVKYNRENGSIMLSCREVRCDGDRAWIEFVCADTGIGMDESFQKHIFEPFIQEKSGARSTYGGTGLGMSIAKSLVDKMGGVIEISSRKDKGTTFRITIPLGIDDSQGEELECAGGGEVSVAGCSVILAEDNELNMEITQFILENAGVNVTRAFDGGQAVDLFASSKPGEYDAILMDVMMPVMDGYQATGKIRLMDRPDAASIPIIAMTANAFPEDRQKAKNAGMNDHLAKPLESHSLLRMLGRYIGSAQ